MDLAIDGGACFPKTDSRIHSPGVCIWEGLPELCILKRHCCLLKTHTHTKPKELAAVAHWLLEDCRNRTGCNPACWSHAKLYLRLPKLGYLAAFHEWFRHHIIYGGQTTAALFTQSSGTEEERGLAFRYSVFPGEIVKAENHCAKDDW